MNRNQEYLELTRALEQLQAPDGSVERALARQRAERRGSYVIRPLIGLAAVFAVFVFLVNVSPTVAQACAGIPVLQDLAAAVQFSPSLSEAVDNEYYQRVDRSQTVDGTTVTVDYLIVDQKTVNIFFRVENEGEAAHNDLVPEVALPEGESKDFGLVWHKNTEDTEKPMDYCGINFDDSVPDRLLLRFYPRSMDEEALRQTTAPFEFLLEFDPNFTAQGKHYSQDRVLELDGQRVHITGIDVYPSYLSFSVEGAPENTAWLSGLDYYLLTEDGTRCGHGGNGICALYDPEIPEWRSFRTDSLFFRDVSRVTLCITGAAWTHKEAETRLDLEHGTAENLPENAQLIRCKRQDGGWLVTLLVQGNSPQCFQFRCYDPEGGEHLLGKQFWDYNAPEDPDGPLVPEGFTYWSFELEDYPWNEVRLTPARTTESSFDPPVTVDFELNP